MQFGLFTLFDFFPDRQNEVVYYKDTFDFVIQAEKLGFDSVWMGEEHFYSFGICPSPQLFLTALARETTRMRLGSAISLLPFENPLRKAEDFAMLDILSGGRLNFGVGRGVIGLGDRGNGGAVVGRGGRIRGWRLRRLVRRRVDGGRRPVLVGRATRHDVAGRFGGLGQAGGGGVGHRAEGEDRAAG